MFDPSSLEIHMMLNPDMEDTILDSSTILSSAICAFSVLCLNESFICGKKHRGAAALLLPT